MHLPFDDEQSPPSLQPPPPAAPLASPNTAGAQAMPTPAPRSHSSAAAPQLPDHLGCRNLYR